MSANSVGTNVSLNVRLFKMLSNNHADLFTSIWLSATKIFDLIMKYFFCNDHNLLVGIQKY